MRQRKAAFTLVELLVVIAIITMLAAMVYPALVRAQIQARETSCRTNLKQIGVGLYTYMVNWNRLFIANRPPDVITQQTSTPTFGSYDDLSPLWGVPSSRKELIAGKFVYTLVVTESYVRDVHSFNCPTTRDRAGTLQDKTQWYKELRYKRTGAGMTFTWSSPQYKVAVVANKDLVPRPQLSYEYCGEFDPNMLYLAVNSSRAWLVHDEDANNENTKAVLQDENYEGLKLTKDSNHGKRGGNMLFLDGHTEWINDMHWVQRVADGIKEWTQVTSWELSGPYLDQEIP